MGKGKSHDFYFHLQQTIDTDAASITNLDGVPIRSCSTILPTIAATTTAITRSSGRHEELWSLLCVLFHPGNVLEQTLLTSLL